MALIPVVEIRIYENMSKIRYQHEQGLGEHLPSIVTGVSMGKGLMRSFLMRS